MVDAEVVDFEADKEQWSTYILHDGTALKVKAVVTICSSTTGSCSSIYSYPLSPAMTPRIYARLFCIPMSGSFSLISYSSITPPV